MKSKLIKFFLHLAVTGVRIMPKAMVPWIAGLFSMLAPRLLKRDSRLIEANVARVYKLPPHSVFTRDFKRQVFRSQALIALETFKHLFSPKPLVKFHGREILKATLAKVGASGNGLIFVTAHHGSWEFVASEIALATGKTFVALAKPSKVPEFTEVLSQLRGRGNTRVLLTDSKNLLRDMMKTLKDNGNLGFVMDQKPEGRVGPIVDFLGQPTEFVTGPAKLAKRHSSPVIALFCIRTAPWEYRIEFELVLEPEQTQGEEQVLTQKMASAITRSIELYPEQWIWNYKRWRMQKS